MGASYPLEDDRRVALAATALANGTSVTWLDGKLVLRPSGGELRCDVLDPTPLAHRCEHEYEVLVENAQRALEASKLAAFLPHGPRTWHVVADVGGSLIELWPVSADDE